MRLVMEAVFPRQGYQAVAGAERGSSGIQAFVCPDDPRLMVSEASLLPPQPPPHCRGLCLPGRGNTTIAMLAS